MSFEFEISQRTGCVVFIDWKRKRDEASRSRLDAEYRRLEAPPRLWTSFRQNIDTRGSVHFSR